MRWALYTVAQRIFVCRIIKTSRIAPRLRNSYIIPPIPGAPAPAGIGGTGSFFVATTDSVVRNVAATDVAI